MCRIVCILGESKHRQWFPPYAYFYVWEQINCPINDWLMWCVGGLDAGLTTLLCKRSIVAKSKEVKTGSSLAEFSKEGWGSKKRYFASDDDVDDDMVCNWTTCRTIIRIYLTSNRNQHKGTIKCSLKLKCAFLCLTEHSHSNSDAACVLVQYDCLPGCDAV
jgi:hypothetical protein